MKTRVFLLCLLSVFLLCTATGCSSKEAKMDAYLDECEVLLTDLAKAYAANDPVKMLEVQDRFEKSKFADFNIDEAEVTTEQKIRFYKLIEKLDPYFQKQPE